MSIVPGLTAVVLAKNEEKNIERCLNSLQFCENVIVIDDESIDRTREIAVKCKAQVITHKLESNFSLQRNYGQDLATGEWILYIDADEEVTAALASEITHLLTDTTKIRNNSAFYIRRRDYWWGKELQYGETATARTKGFIRLIRKNSGKWQGKVHEIFNTSGQTEQLRHYLNHYPHPAIKDFLREINFYSSLRAKELMAKNTQASVLEIIFYPLGKFWWIYLIKQGYKDKAAGFVYAFFMSFHSFLVRSKLYQYRNIDTLSLNDVNERH